ncbi:MAG: hypothetical protein K0R69_3494 [Clostridia bacterium]|nr:hypothetical protein [Clostridia bacterium]
MNEALIKDLIKCKLNIVDSIINSLPEKVSEDVKNLGRIVLESVNDSCEEIKKQPLMKLKTENKLQSVPIE